MSETPADSPPRSRRARKAVELVEPSIADRDYVSSLARGLEVIRAFTRATPRMTLSEVAEQTDMNRAAARRCLLTLVEEGYAETDGRYFRLRPKILELGFSVLAALDVEETIQPALRTLSARLGESCFAAVLDGPDVVYVGRALADRVLKIGIAVGSRAPAHCMSTGRVLLAALPDEALEAYLAEVKLERFTTTTVTSKRALRAAVLAARTEGWASVDQEYEIGLRSISAPIRNRKGTVVAALNVCCPAPRVAPEEMQGRILPQLLAAAAEISVALPA